MIGKMRFYSFTNQKKTSIFSSFNDNRLIIGLIIKRLSLKKKILRGLSGLNFLNFY